MADTPAAAATATIETTVTSTTTPASATVAGKTPRPTTRIRVLPHPRLCPEGVEFESPQGRVLIDELLRHGIAVEHACEKVCACSTCHVHLREGGEMLAPPDEEEEDRIDEAWSPDAQSRLACCVRIKGSLLLIELPRYSKNHAREA